jgi:hypothetical protein
MLTYADVCARRREETRKAQTQVEGLTHELEALRAQLLILLTHANVLLTVADACRWKGSRTKWRRCAHSFGKWKPTARSR